MSLHLKRSVIASRPRFRLYTVGPYLVGVAASGRFISNTQTSLQIGTFVLYLLFFLFPANLLIYGINDIADTDTDEINPKKDGYETKHTQSQTWPLIRSIATTHLLIHGAAIYLLESSDVLSLMISSLTGLLLWTAFYLTSIFYSAQPIRAKARPFIDAFFNVLYILPALIGYTIFGGTRTSISRLAFIAGWLWCMAMHTYSAIPDIEPDKQAGLTTTAVYLGESTSLIWCGFLWLLAAVLAYPYLGVLSCIAGSIYAGMTILSFKKPVFELYKRFPRINGLIGFLLFRRVVLIV